MLFPVLYMHIIKTIWTKKNKAYVIESIDLNHAFLAQCYTLGLEN